MRQPFIVTSGANAMYFYYLQGLILSIREKPEGRDVPIGVLDLGLEPDQLAWLASHVQHVVRPGWDIEFPGCGATATHIQSMTARPHLPDHFPGYQSTIWFDADTWVQEWEAIEVYAEAAATKGFAAAPEVHPCYAGYLTRSSALRERIWKWYAEPFGEEVAERFQHYQLINTGVFAIHRDSPVRPCWIENMTAALQKPHNYMFEIMSLNKAVYENFEVLFPEYVEFLPARFNWMCHQAAPLLDEQTGIFYTPNKPHEQLAVLHLTSDPVKARGWMEVPTRRGPVVRSSLLYREGAYSRERAEFRGWKKGESGWAERRS